jgi:hypothetical protein
VLAEDRRARDQTIPGGNPKSSGKGGGRSLSGGAQVDPVGNVRLRGEDPSPDNRRRGETSHADEHHHAPPRRPR